MKIDSIRVAFPMKGPGASVPSEQFSSKDWDIAEHPHGMIIAPKKTTSANPSANQRFLATWASIRGVWYFASPEEAPAARQEPPQQPPPPGQPRRAA
jgi:hypothetical protein